MQQWKVYNYLVVFYLLGPPTIAWFIRRKCLHLQATHAPVAICCTHWAKPTVCIESFQAVILTPPYFLKENGDYLVGTYAKKLPCINAKKAEGRGTRWKWHAHSELIVLAYLFAMSIGSMALIHFTCCID